MEGEVLGGVGGGGLVDGEGGDLVVEAGSGEGLVKEIEGATIGEVGGDLQGEVAFNGGKLGVLEGLVG